ncbi:MAG: hypothetical protein KatS3mg103_0227 [Phycisphaerales bacterium]|nr:MAG: hypothetical protein KatS3mg103_0227 [Phycisphaerales bacterium]
MTNPPDPHQPPSPHPQPNTPRSTPQTNADRPASPTTPGDAAHRPHDPGPSLPQARRRRPGPSPRRWLRRVRIAWLAATFLIANAVTAGFLLAWADATRIRVDVTATGEHRLADQTRRLLQAMDAAAGYELVVAADPARVDPRAWQALLDVAQELEAAGPIRVSTLAGTAARPGIEALAQRLADREATAIQAQRQALGHAVEQLLEAADQVESAVVQALQDAAEAARQAQAPQRMAQVMAERAQAAPRLAEDLRRVAQQAQAHLSSTILPGVDVPAIDRARSVLAPVAQDAAAQLALLADEARVIAQDRGLPEALRRAAIALAQAVAPARDRCASAADAAQRLPSLDVLGVLRSIGQAATAVLIGPDQAVAIDAQALLPPPGVLRPEAATLPSLRGRIEGLLATAMLTALDPSRPILIVAHAEDSRFIERPGALGAALDHLRRQGVDVLEWPILLEPDPPGLLRLDPAGTRPLVHLVLNTNTAVHSSDPMAPRPDERAQALGRLIERLIARASPLLVNLTPSEVVVGGGIDATAAPLSAFGLHARSGLALLRQPPQARTVEHDLLVTGSDRDHPIQGAIAGLVTYLPWAVPIEHDGSADAWPLLRVQDQRVWAESRWSGYRRVPRNERPLVGNPPQPEPDSDQLHGPWTVAWAAEKPTPDGPARVVVVGSNDWLADDIITAGQSLDGRMVASYPGNLALLDASLLWLTGRDAYIAPTVSTSSVAMVRPLDPATLSALRWTLVLGVPVLILAIGGLWRLLRG